MPSRRAAIAAVASSALLTETPHSASTASASPPPTEGERTYVSGTATLRPGLSIDDDGSAADATTSATSAALYVTARPSRPDNVPRAILDGSRGRPPPVLSARFADPTFPFDFELTSSNFTPEGAARVEAGSSSNEGDVGGVWWSGEDLVVSARYDADGVAATRDPTDLVGRGVRYASDGKSMSVPIELAGRGLFGKSVTAKK